MVVIDVKDENEFNRYTSTEGVVVVDFFAKWCGPCKMMSPVFEKLSDNTAYKPAVFLRVDVDLLASIAEEHDIRVMPTFKIFKNGEVMGGVAGSNAQLLESIVKEHAIQQ